MSTSPPPSTSIGVVFSRIFWMLIGPLMLVLVLYRSADRGGGWVTSTDIFYFIVLAALPVTRWVEFLGGDPRTSTGEPASIDHFRRYASVTILLGVAVWVAAKLISSAGPIGNGA